VRAIKSLMRIGCASVLQQRQLYNALAHLSVTRAFKPVHIPMRDTSRFNGFWRKGNKGSRWKRLSLVMTYKHRPEGRC